MWVVLRVPILFGKKTPAKIVWELTLKNRRYLKTRNIIFWEFKLSNQVKKVNWTFNDLFLSVYAVDFKTLSVVLAKMIGFFFGLYNMSTL